MMNNFDYTDADFDAALAGWLELHKDMKNHSHDCAPQNIHTADDGFRIPNAPHDTASNPIPTTLMGTFTQTNYTYPVPVSNRKVDRRIDLPFRTTERPGPCWAHVGPILVSVTILSFHHTQSLLRCKIHRPQAGSRHKLVESLLPCHQFGSCNE